MRGPNAARFFGFANPLRSIAAENRRDYRGSAYNRDDEGSKPLLASSLTMRPELQRGGAAVGAALPLPGLPAFAPEGTLWPLAKNALPNEVRGAASRRIHMAAATGQARLLSVSGKRVGRLGGGKSCQRDYRGRR